MLSFFRNKEIKIFTLLLLIITTIAVVVGFMINSASGFLVLLFAILINAIFIYFTKNRYKDISDLSEQLNIVLHGNKSFEIADHQEGELSILRSEIYKMTTRLKEQSELLEKDKLFLSDAMTDIAHQLKTPLTSANMIISFLHSKSLDENRRIELLHELSTLLTRVDWLITTLLRMSKIDAGTAMFQKNQVFIKDLIEKSIEPFLIPLELREIMLMTNGEHNAKFIGDLNWSSEALGNVIKNCMEHCENGGRVEIDYIENAIFSQITISDNGGGIDKKDLPYIFERFYQGTRISTSNNSRNLHSRENSFGVGLAFARMVFSLQNATIKATNKDDGAVFTIKFYNHTII